MTCGVFMLVYGEEPEMTTKAVKTFLETADYPYQLLVHATKLGSETYQALIDLKVNFYEELRDASLPQAFNFCYNILLQDESVSYISSIHNDMEFPRSWMRKLIERLEEDKTIGKISPINLRDGDLGSGNDLEREGNECPWIMPRHVLEKVGGEDENYLGGGSSSDWDFNRRIMNAGYRCLITPDTQVLHHAMRTRFKYNTTNQKADLHNKNYYFMKWGDLHNPI